MAVVAMDDDRLVAVECHCDFLIAGGIILFTLFSYMRQSDVNPITGEKQRVALADEKDEIALGLQSAPAMARQHGGLHPNQQYQAIVDQVGMNLIRALNQHVQQNGRINPYQFDFHLLADERAINAFALPGGQCFITYALLERLANYEKATEFGKFEDRLAGVLAHEVGHVVARHGNQRMAKQKLTQGLVGAVSVGAGGMQGGQMAAMVGKMINMKYGRNDELEADKWGVSLSAAARYDARALLDVMEILDESAPGGGPPEMMSTHPKPANRRAYIAGILKDAGIQVQ